MKELKAVFVPPFYGINIRIDNRVKRGKVMPDKKLKGFMKCNKETYDWLKNHPDMQKYKFS